MKESVPHEGDGRRRKRRWIWFWSVNALGLVLVIPVLTATWPLLEILWNTRSSEAVASNPGFRTGSGGDLRGEFQSIAEESAGLGDREALERLSSRLNRIGDLDSDQLNQWAKDLFGETEASLDSTQFDLESATFNRIEKEVRKEDDADLYVYYIELIDKYGNKDYRMAAYAQPDADFERSIMTLKWIDENPQLKKIYQAFSHVIGQSAGGGTADPSQEPPLE